MQAHTKHQQHDANLGLRDPLGSQRLPHDPAQPTVRDTEDPLSVVYVDGDHRQGSMVAVERHYAVLWSGYFTRP